MQAQEKPTDSGYETSSLQIKWRSFHLVGLVERVEVEGDGEKKMWQENQTLLLKIFLHLGP